MKTAKVVLVVLMGLALTGCATSGSGSGSKGISYNMTQSIARSGGDIAMTEALDKGVDKAKARQFVSDLVALIEKGQIPQMTKDLLRLEAGKLAARYGVNEGYVSALMAVVPSNIAAYELIPEKVRATLLSFLKDGALRASDLYKDEYKPTT